MGITGFAQHGKDSTARVLVERYGFTRYALADMLKETVLALNPIVLVDDDDEANTGVEAGFYRLDELTGFGYEPEQVKGVKEVRRLYQAMGTDAGRNVLGEDVWVQALESVIGEKLYDQRSRVVISDVRFPNEADWIHSLGGELWRVKRYVELSGSEKLVPYDNGIGTEHPSEAMIERLNPDVVLRAWDPESLEREVVASVGEGP